MFNFLRSLLLILLASPLLFAQKLEKQQYFTLKTPFTEPDNSRKILPLSADPNTFVALSKVIHNQNNYGATYSLERWDSELQKQWTTDWTISENEEPLELFENKAQAQIYLFSLLHQPKQRKAAVKVYAYGAANGTLQKSMVLDSVIVGAWKDTANKATVKETLLDHIAAFARPRFMPQHDYRYTFAASPDGAKLLFYLYDYSLSKLHVRYAIFNTKNLEKQSVGLVGLDEMHTNFGVYLNNKGELFMPTTQPNTGAVVLWRYQPATQDFSKIGLPFSQYSRDDLKLQILSDNLCSVYGMLRNDSEKMVGLFAVNFDFGKMIYDKAEYIELNDEFRYYVDSLRNTMGQMYSRNEDWRNFEITHLLPTPQGGRLVLLEKREPFESNYKYAGLQARKAPKEIKEETKISLRCESVWAVNFDANNKPLWQQYLPKSQSNTASDGLQTISFIPHIQGNKLKLLYATAKVQGAPLLLLKIQQLDLATGQNSSVISIPNDDKMTLVRPFAFFLPNGKLIAVGRTGLLSNQSNIYRYTTE